MTYHHADVVLFASLALFDSLVNDEIHKRIKATQHSSHQTASIQSHYQQQTHVTYLTQIKLLTNMQISLYINI